MSVINKPLLPKGVCFKQDNRLYFKFKLPWTGRYTTLRSGCDFSINGINDYLQKARLLKLKLNEIKKTGITSSEFERWYSVNIFSEVKSTDDKLTFRAILKIIEDEYYQGKHKFTGEKRSRDDVSCIRSFNNAYGFYFEKIDNLDDYPTIENCLNYLNNFKDDSKSKYEALGKIKKIISYCSDNTQKLILPKLSKIKLEKPKASNGKAIDFEQFWNWLSEQYQIIDSLETHKATERLSWLWVYKMCVAFGLRPSEIMSAINLYESINMMKVRELWGEKGMSFGVGSNSINPAFNDSINNPEMLLILGNYFEIKDTSQKVIKVSTKTGGRFCYPLIKDKIILNKLNLQDVPLLPTYTPESNSKPDTIAQGFSKKLRQQLTLWNCPTSQGYSFRHLGKMLGKLSGLNPSIIADNMGHSLSASEQFYNRKTLNTAKDLAKTDGYPLPLNIAKQQLEINGIDTEDSIVQAVLRIVYQMR